MKLAHFEQQVVFLQTDNLAQTADFYEQILGLPLVLDQGSCRIYRGGGDGYIGFCHHLAAPREKSDIILTLVTQDVEGWYRHLREKGATFEKPPALNERFNIFHCFLRDPNGYLIEIQRFQDPAWPPPGSAE